MQLHQQRENMQKLSVFLLQECSECFEVVTQVSEVVKHKLVDIKN